MTQKFVCTKRLTNETACIITNLATAISITTVYRYKKIGLKQRCCIVVMHCKIVTSSLTLKQRTPTFKKEAFQLRSQSQGRCRAQTNRFQCKAIQINTTFGKDITMPFKLKVLHPLTALLSSVTLGLNCTIAQSCSECVQSGVDCIWCSLPVSKITFVLTHEFHACGTNLYVLFSVLKFYARILEQYILQNEQLIRFIVLRVISSIINSTLYTFCNIVYN